MTMTRNKDYKIPYEDLEVRHLGELYENILEYKVILADSDRIRRRSKKGIEILLASETSQQKGDVFIRKGDVFFGETALERKQTGSYYTPESLVRFINEKTIIQPLYQSFERDYRQRFNELLEHVRKGHDVGTIRGAAQSAAALIERFVDEVVLNFKVCDPAMGSGHFLVDAANQLAGLVVALLEEVPFVEGMTVSITSCPNEWRRRITRHCIYGVDLNPLAVNLAKLSLWLNCFAIEHKLTFLDHHLRCGNSLTGIRSLNQLATVPNRKKGVKKKDDPQRMLFDFDDLSAVLAEAAKDVASITQIDEDDTDSQRAALDEALEISSKLKPLADLYTSYLMKPENSEDSYANMFYSLAKGTSSERTPSQDLMRKLESVFVYSDSHHFLHWPLEFPDVFSSKTLTGFSAIVGNPPWDKLKPNSKEFFSSYDPKFRTHKKQEANRISKKLMEDNPNVAKKWMDYCSHFKELSNYFKEPIAYSAVGKGDIDLFKVFLEQSFNLLSVNGHLGFVIPSSFYANIGCMPLRKRFLSKSEIKFIYSFENRNPTVFKGVMGLYNFATLGLRKGSSTKAFKCAFMEHDPERLHIIEEKALTLAKDNIQRFSPDSLSIMEFSSQIEIDITKKIYGSWPLMGAKTEKSWNIAFRSEFHMTNDSHLFKLEPTDFPLYEGKNIWQFNHKYSKFRYWLNQKEAYEALANYGWETNKYRVAYRDIGRGTDERTLISTIIPPGFHGNKLPTVVPYRKNEKYSGPNDSEALFLTSLLCSFPMDFLMRRKVITTLNFFLVNSLPLPRLSMSSEGKEKWFFMQIVARSARLICTDKSYSQLWECVFNSEWKRPEFWCNTKDYPAYGPKHEQEVRKRLTDSLYLLSSKWNENSGTTDSLGSSLDTEDRAQIRSELDAIIAHLFELNKDEFDYILNSFPVLKKKEEKVFGEYQTRRKCLEEFERYQQILNVK